MTQARRKTRRNQNDDAIKRYYLTEWVSLEPDSDALEAALENVYIFEGTTKEYAEDFADSAGGPMMAFTNADYYFDYDSFGRDLKRDAALEGGLEQDLEDKEEELEDADDEDEVEDIQEEIDDLKESIKYYEDMSDEDYGVEYVSNSYGDVKELPESTQEQYFDYDAVVRSMEANGDVFEFEYEGTTYVAQGPY
jgi:hypothetical protein